MYEGLERSADAEPNEATRLEKDESMYTDSQELFLRKKIVES
jgi:hypothetical protein